MKINCHEKNARVFFLATTFNDLVLVHITELGLATIFAENEIKSKLKTFLM